MNSSEPNQISIVKPITKHIDGIISGTQQDLEAPLFAINWFDTRSALLYDIYNCLAAPRLFRVGGKVFFKGKVTCLLAGDPKLGRAKLLIVNYPSAGRFLKLMADPLFLITGLLRSLSVKRFSFVLHKRVDPAQESEAQTAGCHYAILHLTDDLFSESLVARLGDVAGEFAVDIYFQSRAAGRLSTRKKNSAIEAVEAITDHVIMFESPDVGALSDFFESPQFNQILSGSTGFYAGAIDRIL